MSRSKVTSIFLCAISPVVSRITSCQLRVPLAVGNRSLHHRSDCSTNTRLRLSCYYIRPSNSILSFLFLSCETKISIRAFGQSTLNSTRFIYVLTDLLLVFLIPRSRLPNSKTYSCSLCQSFSNFSKSFFCYSFFPVVFFQTSFFKFF